MVNGRHQASDENETARALARELHELLKDGKRLRQDLQDVREEICDDVRTVTSAVANEYVKDISVLLRGYADEIFQTVEAANAVVRQRAAELSGMKTTDDLLAEIIARLTGPITESLADGIDRATAEVAREMVAAASHRGEQHGKDRILPPAVIIGASGIPTSGVPSVFGQRLRVKGSGK